MKKKSRQAQPVGISFAILNCSIFENVYNVNFIPHCRLHHRISKILEVCLVVLLRDSNAALRVLPVGVATCQVDNTEGAVGVMVRNVAALFAHLDRAGEIRWRSRNDLQHAPGVFLSG